MINLIIMLCIAVIAIGSFLCGLVVGGKLHPKDTKPALNGKQEDKKPIVQLTEDEQREIKRRQLEIQNFFNYNGDPLPDPKEKVYDK